MENHNESISQSLDFALTNAKLLYSFDELNGALDKIAEQLNNRYLQQPVVVITVLQGGLITAGHLLTKLNFPLILDSIYATRYGDKTVGEELLWKQYPHNDLSGKTVILVDDIFDEGLTLAAVHNYCLAQGALEVVSVALLQKQHDRKINSFLPDYSALSIPDVYVFGFGLDYQGYYRNAPGIYCLETPSATA